MSIQPTTQEIATVRTQPHETQLYLSIYKPPIVWQAQVNGSFAKNARVITYDNVTFGSFSSVRTASTLRVGTAPGKADMGTIYVYSIDATTITVGSNSHIDWRDNLYLTAVSYFQIWPLYPRYVINTAVEPPTVTVYKAHDIAYNGNYNNENRLGSMLCAGSNYAGFLENGQATVYFSATGTTNVAGNPIYEYDWAFEGGTPTGSSLETPGNVTWTQPGHYTIRLAVRNAVFNGLVQYAYRHVSIYNRFGEGGNIPYIDWGMNSLSGDRENGGWKGKVWVRQDLTNVNEDIIEGALVVVFSDELRGGTAQAIGGNAVGRDSIVFVGYILNGSITYNYDDSTVEFEVGSPNEIAKQCEAFSLELKSTVDPMSPRNGEETGISPWFRIQNMTAKYAIHHYMFWHSTYNVCNDMQWTANDYKVRYFDADRASLWDCINTFVGGSLNAQIVCDIQGKTWFEDGIKLSTGSSQSLMSLDNRDWMSEPQIEEQIVPTVSYLQMGGAAYAGPANDTGADSSANTAYLAESPGNYPAYRGRQQRQEGLIIDSQSRLNFVTGNYYAYLNAKYPKVLLRLVGNYRVLDIAPLKQIALYLTPAQNNRGLNWEGKKFGIEGMSWEYNPQDRSFLPTISMHEIVAGSPADAIIIPVEPPADVPPVVNPPTINPPNLPPIPPAPGFGAPTCCVGYGRATFGPISEETVHSPVAGTWYLFGENGFYPTGHNPQATLLADPAGNTASTYLSFSNVHWSQNAGVGDANYSGFLLPYGGVWRISGNIILAKDSCTIPTTSSGVVRIAVVSFLPGTRPSDEELDQNIFFELDTFVAASEISKHGFSMDWDGGSFVLGIKHSIAGSIYECGNSKVYVDFVHALSAY